MIRIGINGFGRIGRCVTRHIMNERSFGDDMQIVQINASGGEKTNMHLLKYDTVHGRYTGPVHDDILWTEERDINKLIWRDCDVVLECTGAYNDGEVAARHTRNGANKVLISAPAKNVDCTVVYGVNHDKIKPTDTLISNASCTTNCLAPLVKVLDQKFGIISGQMTTVHSYTGDQGTIDRRHRDMYRARAAGSNMIPTSTGAAKALQHVYPNLAGKIAGSAIRVPTQNVSCVDLTVLTEKDATEQEVNGAVLDAALREMRGIIGYEELPLVSSDFNTTKESCIFAPEQTRVSGYNLIRVMAWYDNEWAFSCRMADVAKHLWSISNG